MEQLFGMSEISFFDQKNDISDIISLLVLLPDKIANQKEKQLLERMLDTLELAENQYKIINLRHGGSAEFLIKKYCPKAVLAMGRVVDIFNMNDLERNFSCKYGKISVVGSYSPAHLLENPHDKKQSWQSLLLLKSQLKS